MAVEEIVMAHNSLIIGIDDEDPRYRHDIFLYFCAFYFSLQENRTQKQGLYSKHHTSVLVSPMHIPVFAYVGFDFF